MNLTAQNEIKYTLLVPLVSELYKMSVPYGYTGPQRRKSLIAFINSLGYDCAHWSTAQNKNVFGKF